MAWLKWFDKVHAAQAAQAHLQARSLELFDFDSLVTSGFFARLLSRFMFRIAIPLGFALLRTFAPVLRIGRLVIVSRYDDVCAVLENRQGSFPVVYSIEMEALGGGAQGVLGMDGPDHEALRAQLWGQLLPDDLPRLREWARANAEALLRAGGGEIDIIRDLLTRTATEVCCRYFGLSPQDPDAFAEWAMAVSMQLFGDPLGTPNINKQARIGSILLNSLVDDAIERAKNNHREDRKVEPAEIPVIERLVTKTDLSDDTIRASIVGMATGFVPTNTLAAGNMLDELLRRPLLYAAARDAAEALVTARQAQDAAAEQAALGSLETALLTAGRYNPALSPGIWRHAPAGGIILREGHRSAKRIPPGSIILASVFSALRDSRMPREVAGDPRKAAQLIFGTGPHSCIGARIAMVQITEVFAALLTRPGLAPAKTKWGKMWRAGPFPVRFDMRYDCSTAGRALLVSALTIREGVTLGAAQDVLAALGNPARDDVAATCEATGCIDFLSLNVIEAASDSDRAILLVEVNGDGTDAHVIGALTKQCPEWLGRALALCTIDGIAPTSARAMGQMILDNVLKLHRNPWGPTGLHFDGLDEMSVADVARQNRLAEFARQCIDWRLKHLGNSDARAMDLLQFVRRIFKQDAYWARRSDVKPLLAWLQENSASREVAYGIVRPSRKRLRIADWQPPKTLLEPVWPLLRSPDGRPIVMVVAALWLGLGFAIYRWVLASPHSLIAVLWRLLKRGLFDPLPAWPAAVPSPGQFVWALSAGTVGGMVAALLVLGTMLGLIVWRIRVAERHDRSDDGIVALDHLKAIAAREDEPGYEQNHIIAVMPMKRGPLRRLTLAFTMWWIKQAVTFWFRPGFVVTMGTIHKARWFLIPGTRQFVFHSNYDGSWESYLEDFITRASPGQTSAWSHGEGFPPTRYLVLDGASDGDRFKRWVRKQQRPSLCWYSRFPHLTTTQIRRNAMIEDGLARAASDTDARRWLAHFGSAQREPGELESQEVQTLVFSGLPQHTHATTLALRLPSDPRVARQWVSELLDKGRGDAHAAPGRLARIGFGDTSPQAPLLTFGLTAAGLARLGLEPGKGYDQLPGAFAIGMAGRTRLLGDTECHDWRWSDAGDATNGAEAVLIVYGGLESGTESPGEAHRGLVARHTAHIVEAAGTIVHAVPCSPVLDASGREHKSHEHFGFRDGISQPAIRGSRKATTRAVARDIVAPGEFLLGYRNDQGYVAPPIGIGAHLDPRSALPTVAESATNRFPFYGNRSANPDLRDFGRNGSFLVLRQLDQDTAGFDGEMSRAAAQLNASYRHLPTIAGQPATPEWFAAKVIGRWQNGTPLVGNPDQPGELGTDERPDNDFAFGIDDPRGHACPLGAHIRRTNPRDSLEPGDKQEEAITNRHRLLRRGRSYAYRPDGTTGDTKGLLFAALCSDLERQFEFVQHTWINASSFHGMTAETDPLLGNPQNEDGKTSAALVGGTNTRFTIPTATGPVVMEGLRSYVTVRAGGYFFLPSRSALNYLTTALPEADN